MRILTHNGAHTSENSAAVVTKDLEIPGVFGTGAVLVAREAVTPDSRVYAACMHAHVAVSLLSDAPKLGFYFVGRRFGSAEPHAHGVASDPVERVQRHVSALRKI